MKLFFSFFLLVVLLGVGCSPVYVIKNEETPTLAVSENIKVTSPLSGEVVGNPIRVIGEGRVFENVVSWRLRDSSGEVLISGTTEAASPDMGQFGPFDFYAVVPATDDKNITLEVFWASAKDGSDTDLVSVPLVLERTDSAEIKLYFHNNDMDPEITCVKTFPVTRKIVATPSVARAAIVSLLQGPSEAEITENYSTTIPFRTELKDISLSSEGLATVDLKGAIAGPIGGSCYVSAIGHEVEDTLKQFELVKEVRILIEGEENKLEP